MHVKRSLLEVDLDNGSKILDVGCGNMPYRELFHAYGEYQGIDTFDAEEDFGYKNGDVIHYDGVYFPIGDDSIDVVFHSEVMEHIFDTRHFLSECYRVARKGGNMVFTVPFQARFHYIPNDYWRFTPSCIRSLLAETGFSGVEIFERGTDLTVGAYKVLSLGYRLFFSRSWWKMVVSMILSPIWLVSLLAGQISLHFGIGSKDDCLGYVVQCRKE